MACCMHAEVACRHGAGEQLILCCRELDMIDRAIGPVTATYHVPAAAVMITWEGLTRADQAGLVDRCSSIRARAPAFNALGSPSRCFLASLACFGHVQAVT